MSIERIESLRSRHQHLDQELQEEFHRPLPDDAKIAQLKREKLRLKDEMVRMNA